MIVNLKYFKNQWPGFSSLGITNCGSSSSNLRRTLYMFTALQFWLQLFSIMFLASCVVSQWYSNTLQHYSHLNDSRFVKFNFNAFIVFQLCDLILSAYASFQFRNAASLYNNIQDVKSWAVVNNLYLLWTLSCFIFSTKITGTDGSSFEICIRMTSMALFACYKVYIVYQIYKNDKSAYIFLEQSSIYINDSSKLPSNENHSSIATASRPVVLEILTETEDQEKF